MDTTKGITVLSLFDGMSCGQIALREAGIKVNKYFASEIDKHAIAQTQHNFPDAVEGLRNEYKERITHGIIAAIWERGIVEFTEERDPDTNELRIRGSLYVGIRKDNENINPFNN